MPTYDYVCQACDHHWDEFQNMSAGPKRKCPACGKLKAKRLIGAGAGIIFKGTGFYVTDYKNHRPGAKGDASKKPAGAKPPKKAAPKSEV